MLGKINNNQITDIMKESSAMHPNPSNAPKNDQADVSIHVSYDSLIEQAKQPPQKDPNAVQRARQLLLSGQLDCLEINRATAEKIAKFGI
jgi:hypothetical protein